MKQLVLVAFLAALGSSALTLLGTTILLPTPSAAPPPDRGETRPGMAEVVRELAVLRRDLTEAIREGATRPSAGVAAPAGPALRPGADLPISPPSHEAQASPLVQVAAREKRITESIDTDPASDRLGAVKKNERAKWFLRSDRDVAAWFGAPDTVFVDEKGVESWSYYMPEGSPGGRDSSVVFEIHAGRVISFH
jgi:hypothetical protein